MRYDNYLLMSDLDGTLIGSDHKVSQQNLDAIADFTAQGGSFAIATGRTVQSVRMHLNGLPLDAPCILYNGAALYSFTKEAFLSTEHLQKELFTGFLEDCIRSFPRMIIEIFTADGMSIITSPANKDPYVELEAQVYRYATLAEVLQLDWIKILLNDEHENLLAAREKLLAYRLGTATDSVFSLDCYLELLPKHVSKGTALGALRSVPAYKGKIIVAVGDFDNDIEMIRAADIGVAVGNAAEHIQKIADEVTVHHDEHAMADIIYRILPKHMQAK